MLYEFADTLSTLKNLYNLNIDIVDNNGVDVINLQDLQNEASNLANRAFIYNRDVMPTQSIAEKDAYDFVKSHDRLNTVYNRDRAFYYSEGSSELDLIMSELEYYKASLTKLEQFGDV